MRALLFALVTIVANLLLLEACSVAAAILQPDLFNTLDADRLERYGDMQAYRAFVARSWDPRLGWRPPASTSHQADNCLGEAVRYHYDERGARRTRVEGRPRILVVGDSYTHGSEVADHETYASRLGEMLDAPVANHGVGGFGPVQALLHYERLLDQYPGVEVGVLGFMLENLLRMRNGYRPAYHRDTGIHYGFKPAVVMLNGQPRIRPNPHAAPFDDREALLALVRAEHSGDYWSTAKPGFPYLRALYRTLQRDSVRMRLLANGRALIGARKYAHYYAHAEFRAGALHLVRRFAEASERRGVRPVVLFLPQNSKDRTSPDSLVSAINADLGHPVAWNAGEIEMDWSRYNLKPDSCHPTALAHEAIARFLAPRVELSQRAANPGD